MHVCKYLNQRVRRIEILSRVFQNQNKKKKKTYKEMIFITQFKTKFLLPFTGCRIVLG